MAFERIELDVNANGVMKTFHTKQFDVGRPIILDLVNDGDAYTPAAGVTFELHCRKVDDNIVIISTYELDGNTLTFASTEQLTACVGKNLATVKMFHDEMEIGTMNFFLDVTIDPDFQGLTSETQIETLYEQVEEITEQVIGDNYYDNTEVDDLLDTKADASTTYTKTEVDTALNLKADKSDTYTKTETNNLLAGKADASDIYSKAQVDSKLSLKADKATTYTKTETDTLLGYKANASQVYTMSQTDLLLADKADKSTTYTKTQVDNALALKANSSDLATVATTGDYDDLLNKPSIPAAQVQSDYAQTDNTQVDYIKNKPDIEGMIADAILEVMPVDTASGPIASFNTALAADYPSVTVNVVATGGNGTPDNPNPIVGYSSANISRCGVNLWDEEWELGTINDSTGEDTPMSDRIRSKNYIPVKNGQTYYFTSTYLHKVIYYDINKNFVSGGDTAWDTKQTYVLPNNVYYIRFAMAGAYGTTYNNDISINYPSTDTEYHAYNGQTFTVAFGQTVYGGVLDVTRGKLHVTWSNTVDLGSLGWSYDSDQQLFVTTGFLGYKNGTPFLCDVYTDNGAVSVTQITNYGGTLRANALYIKNDDYTDATTFKTAMSGKYITAELATPFDIDLTPVQIEAIVGTNNVYSDTNGNTTVKFKDSIQHYIDTKVGS